MASCKDPEAFLAKADEVERLVKGIIANDESAIKDADAFIAKQEGTPPGNASIGVDRTVISSSKSKPQDQAVPPELRAMERDIEERHQRRLEREARANEKVTRNGEVGRCSWCVVWVGGVNFCSVV
eukprot:m.207596 g.207596  ORF g.207596 m.207596 type:complete len:126 (+) comp18523_c0_seq7:72-449(+)